MWLKVAPLGQNGKSFVDMQSSRDIFHRPPFDLIVIALLFFFLLFGSGISRVLGNLEPCMQQVYKSGFVIWVRLSVAVRLPQNTS